LAVTIVVVSTQPVFLLGAAFFDVSADLEFGTTGLGALTAAFFLTASISSAPLGKLVQRVGWRSAMRVNATVSGVLLLAIAGLARNLATLAALLVGAGVVYGLANPAANLSLAEHVDPRRRALMFGLKHAGIPSSTLVAGLAVPVVVLSLGWRWAYALAALLAVGVVLMVPSGDGSVSQPAMGEDPRRRVTPMSSTMLIGLAAGAALATWAAIALSTYLVAAAVDRGFSEASAGWLLFAGSAASISGRVAAGHVTDRIGGRGFGAISALTGTGVAVFAALAFSEGALFAVLVVIAFATGWGWPGLMTFTVVNANAGTAAASSGVTQAGIFVGAGVGPVALGWIADTWSFDAVWLLVAAALAVASSIVATVGRAAVTR
jgi:MFS family permease